MAKQKRRGEQNSPSWEERSRSVKRERFLDETPRKKKSKGTTLYIVGIGALLLSILVGLVTLQQPGAAPNAGGAQVEVTPVDGEVTLPIADFASGQARFYKYRSPQGKTIPFFVIKSSDGVIRAAYDACDVCFPQKKGYRQDGDLMVCNNCGQTFASNRINIDEGGCNPAPLVRTTRGDNVVILEKDISQGVKYF